MQNRNVTLSIRKERTFFADKARDPILRRAALHSSAQDLEEKSVYFLATFHGGSYLLATSVVELAGRYKFSAITAQGEI